MTKKLVYVLPGDLVELRVCDPVFDEGANAGAWHQSLNPNSITVQVTGFSELGILTPFTRAYHGIEPNRRLLK